jgi:uncharacterized protein YbjT (DUF2867 family)
LVGKQLIFELLENPTFLKVVAIVRTALPISNPKLEQIQVEDYSKLHELKEKLNADVFFCCIGTTIKKAGSQHAFRKVDLEIPLAIAKLAKTLNIPSFVIISSIGASANSNNFYLRTKGEMEKAIQLEYSGNLKIARPSLLIGNRDEFRFGEKISIYIMKVLGILLIGPLRKFKGINAADVAKAMIKSIGLPKDKIFIESDELQDLARKQN